MVGFRNFIAVWMLSIACGAILISGIATDFWSNKSTELAQGHFSVRWMGFVPDYSSQYPDYYVCINNLKDATLIMNIALQIKNQEDSGYYFTVEKYGEPPAGWTVPTMYVGLINKDETKSFTYSAYRTKPASIPLGRLTESINLVVKAYYDASYTNLYDQDNFTATFHFIDRTSSVWTILYNDNFDDGTVQGWGYVGPAGLGVSETYYRSYRYSLKLDGAGYSYEESGYRKNFDVATGYQEAYLIFSLRSSWWPDMRILLDGIVYFKPDVSPPGDVWLQFAIPLPVAPPETTEVIIYASRGRSYTWEPESVAYLDDVFVIAK
jgi:hypothetical protein